MLTRQELGLTTEQAETPIHVNGEMWTLLDAARYLHDAHRSDNPDQLVVFILGTELTRLRQEAKTVGDSELIGAADALEKSAREIWAGDT